MASTTKTTTASPASTLLSQKIKDNMAGFVLGGLAACGAVTFTNPWEVVKTRLQLQGELVRAGTLAATSRPYKNSFQGLAMIYKHEGIRGIQRGLGAAYIYQVCLNGTRLGMYEPVKNQLSSILGGDYPIVRLISGGFSGMCGAALGSPLYLVKTRMQSYSPVFSTIGHQHRYTSTVVALSGIWHKEGLRGLYRGMDAAMLRAAVGSSVQLPTYDYAKQILVNRFGFHSEKFITHFSASMICGFFVCCAMNPFDVVSTRMYNQKVGPSGRGSLYNNPLDCVIKMFRTEGPLGFYKGFLAHYLRIGPHTVLMFVFLEQLKNAYKRGFFIYG